MGQYFSQPMLQHLPSASLPDVTAPTFAGITGLAANSDGSLSPSWSAATDATGPVEYRIYLALGSVSAAVLYATTPLFSVYGLSARIYADAANAALVAGSLYTVGVRAEDAVGNVNTNVIVLTQTVTLNLFSLLGLVPSLVWEQLKSAHSTVGSFGAYLDSQVSLTQSAATALSQYGSLSTAIGLTQPASTALAQYNNLLSSIGAIPTAPQLASTALSQYNSIIAALGSIQNNTNFSGIVPTIMDQQFGSATETYRFYAGTFDSTGNPTDPDSNIINISINVDLAPYVTSVAMTRDGIGLYHYDFTVTAAMDDGDVVVLFNYVKASVAIQQIRTSKIMASDENVANILAIKAKTDNLPVDPASATQVATRAPASTAVSSADFTPTRAAKLDQLDAAISSRLAAGAYTAPDNTSISAIKAKTDNLPADPASTTQVNTRLAASAYTAPDNAGIASVKAKTDNLPNDPASATEVATRAPATSALDSAVWTATKAGFLDAAVSSRATAADVTPTVVSRLAQGFAASVEKSPNAVAFARGPGAASAMLAPVPNQVAFPKIQRGANVYSN